MDMCQHFEDLISQNRSTKGFRILHEQKSEPLLILYGALHRKARYKMQANRFELEGLLRYEYGLSFNMSQCILLR